VRRGVVWRRLAAMGAADGMRMMRRVGRAARGCVLVLVAVAAVAAGENEGAAVRHQAEENMMKQSVLVSSAEELEAYKAYNRGVDLEQTGQIEGAAQAYEDALKIKPDMLPALNNLAGIQRIAGKLLDAEVMFTKLLKLAQETGSSGMEGAAYNNLGLVNILLATVKESSVLDPERIRHKAILNYQNALRINKYDTNARYNLANAYVLLEEDENAQREYLQVLEWHPGHVKANMNLANLYVKRNRFDLAKIYHKQALDAKIAEAQKTENLVPEELSSLLNNMGQTLREGGDLLGALEYHREAVRVNPSSIPGVLNAIVATRKLCLWDSWDEDHQELANLLQESSSLQERGIPPYDSLLIPSSVFEQSNQSLASIARAGLSSFTVDLAQLELNPRRTGPLRIGYISYDMREHPMGHLMLGLYTHHDRTKFETFVYMYGEFDESPQRKRIEAAVDHFVDLAQVPVDTALGMIHDDNLDVLVDLMGHTRGAKLMLSMKSSVATYVNYLGYPGTSGLQLPGAFIFADQTVLPAEAVSSKFEVTEQVVYLPDTYQANDMNLTASFCTATVLGHARLRACKEKVALYHLPLSALQAIQPRGQQHTIRFGNLNSAHKYEPKSFKSWCNILRRVPNSVLILLGSKSQADPSVKSRDANLLKQAQKNGVDPRRIIFAPYVTKAEHTERLVALDLFLDTFIYGAHSTGTEVLWAGVPVLTLCGSFFSGKVSTSLLRALNLEELVTNSVDEFENVAVKLATHPFLLNAIKLKLDRNLLRQMLFHTARFTSHFQHALQVTQERHTIGNPELVAIKGHKESLATFQERLKAHLNVGIGLHVSGETAQAANIYRRVLAASDTMDKREREIAGEASHMLGIIEADPDMLRDSVRFKLQPIAMANLGHVLHHQNDIRGSLKAFFNALELSLHMHVQQTFCTNFEHVAHVLYTTELASDHAKTAGAFTLVDLAERYGSQFVSSPGSCDGMVRGLDSLSNAMINDEPFLAARAVKATLPLDKLGSANFARHFRLGVLYKMAGYPLLSLEQFLRTAKSQHEADLALAPIKAKQLAKEATTQSPSKPVVVFYCNEYGQTWWPHWGPRSPLEKGAGGSEEAVIFLSIELVKLGFTVIVYADPVEEDWGVTPASKGVVWLPHSAFDPRTPVDVFVAWRYHISLANAYNARYKALWLHDVVEELYPQFSFLLSQGKVDHIMVGSNFHARELPKQVESIVRVLGCALEETHFVDGNNTPHKFIYASAPNRGLEQLLTVWPVIKQAVPQAELDIYYGFSQTFLTWGKYSIPDFEAWHAKMLQSIEDLKPFGVNYIGMVDHETLAAAYANSGFTLYPTSYSETACVSLMKAMAMGSIPITSRFENSSIPELTEHWDLGPSLDTCRGRTMATDQEFQNLYAQHVIYAATQVLAPVLAEHRSKMKAWARRELLWSAVAKRFAQFASLGDET